LSFLYWHFLSCRYAVVASPQDKKLHVLAWMGLVLVISQVFLGGWVSTNYAALACTELPQCHGRWFPLEDLENAFVLWRGLGVNYEFGVLDTSARVSIHVVHRMGAVVVTLFLSYLVFRVFKCEFLRVRKIGLIIGLALLIQLSLGIANVLGGLPIFVAVGHNGGAGLLLLTLVALIYFTSPRDAYGL
jgi:heme a synthase